MKIIDHGQWEIYEPLTPPPHLRGQKVMFARRVSDQRDWYDYQRELLNDNIKITVDGDNTVQATHRDVSMLFPAGMRMIEVEADIDHTSLRQNIYDGKTFLPPRPPEDIGRINLLATLREFGLDENALRTLGRMAKKQGSDHG